MLADDNDDDNVDWWSLSAWSKPKRTRQHRKALWHNSCHSHNLLRHL